MEKKDCLNEAETFLNELNIQIPELRKKFIEAYYNSSVIARYISLYYDKETELTKNDLLIWLIVSLYEDFNEVMLELIKLRY